MRRTNYGSASRGSNRYWLRQTRTFIARKLLRSGISVSEWIEWLAFRIAPWLQERDRHSR